MRIYIERDLVLTYLKNNFSDKYVVYLPAMSDEFRNSRKFEVLKKTIESINSFVWAPYLMNGRLFFVCDSVEEVIEYFDKFDEELRCMIFGPVDPSNKECGSTWLFKVKK